MLEIQAVSKQYPSPRGWFSREWIPALKDIRLSLEKGEVGILLGPNGAGKTTLLKIIANLVLPDSGTVLFQTRNVHANPCRAAAGISFMAGEEKSFYWRLTGRQNLEFFAALYNIPAAAARRRILELAQTFSFSDLEKMYQEYSTGYRQRLAMMRALLADSDLILMDEPTRSLDPAAAAHFRRLILEQLKGAGKTVLLATHNLEEAREIGDQVFILSEGCVKTAVRRGEITSSRQIADLYETSVVPNGL
jgi:ABC-2 type transport system ATP-binding protein